MGYDKTDFYAGVASKLFGLPVSSVTEKQRNAAKTYYIARSYGANPFDAERLMMKELDIKKFEFKSKDIPRYFSIFQQIAKSFEKILKVLKKWLTPCNC